MGRTLKGVDITSELCTYISVEHTSNPLFKLTFQTSIKLQNRKLFKMYRGPYIIFFTLLLNI